VLSLVKVETKKIKELKIPTLKTSNVKYEPWKVDWRAVISGCRAACNFDKRLCNFYIRAAAHDSLSVSKRRGGADGSMLITEDELSRPENKYDAFGLVLSKNALALAKRFGASVADIIAVCGAVSTEYLGGPKIIHYDKKNPFLVGRYDDKIPDPTGTLPAHNINTTQFIDFSKSRGFTIEEMTALMGSHVLLDNKGCLKENDRDMCDPFKEKCDKLSMFSWRNTYYRDLCYSNITFTTNLKTTKQTEIKNNMCSFTSDRFRKESLMDLAREFSINPTQKVLNEKEVNGMTEPIEVDTDLNAIVKKGLEWKKWVYTIHDANMGMECQRNKKSEIKDAMRKFFDKIEWAKVYKIAYKKMVKIGVKWVKGGLPITGNECNAGYKSIVGGSERCKKCNVGHYSKIEYNCPNDCQCMSAFGSEAKFYDR
jgi:hypothetical protein